MMSRASHLPHALQVRSNTSAMAALSPLMEATGPRNDSSARSARFAQRSVARRVGLPARSMAPSARHKAPTLKGCDILVVSDRGPLLGTSGPRQCAPNPRMRKWSNGRVLKNSLLAVDQHFSRFNEDLTSRLRHLSGWAR